MIGEKLMTLVEAAGKLPRKPHVATLYRWMSRGVRGVRLRTCLIGGRRYTSQEALDEFHAATNKHDATKPDSIVPSTVQPHQKRLDQLIGAKMPRRTVTLPPKRKAS